jgi:hypothetical protein
MKKWQSSFWTVLTLIALFATTLPTLAWACPMTGQIGDAATICQNTMPQTGVATTQLCADPRRCCKPLTLPATNERNENVGIIVQSRTTTAPGQLLNTAQAATGAIAILPSSVVLFAASQRSSLRPAAFLFPLRSQHRPHISAGRAPPAL